MKVLVIEPEKRPVVRQIDNSLNAMQQLVGGLIQAVYPWEEPVALICNDEGKLLGLPPNRALYDPESHQLFDIVSGTFLICGAPRDCDNFTSLTDEQIARYQELFACPELFLRINGRLIVARL